MRTVPVGGANQVSVKFTKDVDVESGDLQLVALNQVVNKVDGDYNNDGIVDAVDYTVWRNTLGSNSDLRADGDFDGVIGAGDYTVWKENYGNVAPPSFFGPPEVTNFVVPDVANGFIATWTFAEPLSAAQWLIRLSDSVQDFSGQALDGEWSNPGSILSDVQTTIFPSGDNVEGGDFEFVFTILPGDKNRDLIVNQDDLDNVIANLGMISAEFTDGDFNGDGVVSVADRTEVLRNFGSNFEDLLLLADYDTDFDIDNADELAFDDLFSDMDSDADLDLDGMLTQADVDAFDELLSLDLDLRVLL